LAEPFLGDLKELFEAWKEQYQVQYETEELETKKFATWRANYKFVR